MSGLYNKAPLSYVSIKISTTDLPSLLPEQLSQLQQNLMQKNLILSADSKGKEINLNQLLSAGSIEKNTLNSIFRKGYLSHDKKECLILEKNSIEYRVTNYLGSEIFYTRFNDLFKTVLNVIPSYQKARSKEYTLNFVDIIVPGGEYQLSDFFKNQSILPLHTLANISTDIFQTGGVNYQRIVTPTEKVLVNIEQLPQKSSRLLPEFFMEPDPEFAMPINLTFMPDNNNMEPYAILTTQASKLIDRELLELDVHDSFLSLHNYSREAFKSIINLDVAKKHWEYKEKDALNDNG